LNSSGKLFVVQPLTWHASRLCVMRRTMVESRRQKVGMRPPSPSIPERDFLLSALQQSLRLDGRALLEARQLKLTFGSDLGWVECSLGKTRYVCDAF
jgi:hypothetical protein